jgi:hypothetical protein
MKVKGDFITNSSSTAFFFIFKWNTKEDLFKEIMRRPKRFEQEVDIGWDKKPHIIKCDAEFVVNSIDKVYGTIGDFYGDHNIVKIKSIDELIKEFKKSLNYWKKGVKHCPWHKGYITETQNQLKAALEAKKKGLNKYIQMNFGDSEGHVHGGSASILRYKQDKFQVRRKDLFVVTDERS